MSVFGDNNVYANKPQIHNLKVIIINTIALHNVSYFFSDYDKLIREYTKKCFYKCNEKSILIFKKLPKNVCSI